MFGWNSTEGWWFSWFGAAIFLPILGFAIYRNWLKSRRRKSLWQDVDGTYVWIEVDGSHGRSRDDPRDKWDAENSADSDGDGGGGD